MPVTDTLQEQEERKEQEVQDERKEQEVQEVQDKRTYLVDRLKLNIVVVTGN